MDGIGMDEGVLFHKWEGWGDYGEGVVKGGSGGREGMLGA